MSCFRLEASTVRKVTEVVDSEGGRIGKRHGYARQATQRAFQGVQKF